jgi:tetratricopeptide (TPR) repeat protein/O-antigen ligase
MAFPTTILFFLSFVAAVLLGPQTRPWTWGPSLILMSLGLLSAITIRSRLQRRLPLPLALLGTTSAAWLIGRMATSPVLDLALADFLLLFSITASIWLIEVVLRKPATTHLFLCGLASLVIASVVVMAKQVADPSYSPIFHSRPANLPSGFYGHYNECANFLIGTSFILACAAVRGPNPSWMRIFWGLAALSGFIGVHFTRSRGGILAVAIGFAAMALLFFISTPKSTLKAVLGISLPFLGILIALFLWNSWNSAQQTRYNASAATVLENPIRISLLDIATECVGMMPWSGSGSRSFSWNCFQFWDVQSHGGLIASPEFVHNELFQVATDYGLIGLTLLGAFLIVAIIFATTRLADSKQVPDALSSGMIIGGKTALLGMMVQSSFSFVFHLLPGALLLGISLGLFIWPSSIHSPKQKRNFGFSLITRFLIGISALAVLTIGIRASRAYACLWTSYFGNPTSPLIKAGALSRAVEFFPSSELYKDLGIASHAAATSGEIDSEEFKNQAISAYEKALEKNPYDPAPSLNLAPLLAVSGDHENAEREFKRIISIQGGAESLLRGHFRLAEYLMHKGMQELDKKSPLAALDTFQTAVEHTHEIQKSAPWVMPSTKEGLTLDVDLHAGIALAFEESGDVERALDYYELAAKIPTGERVNFPWAKLLGSVAKTAWMERRPSEALSHFQKARDLVQNTKDLPPPATEQEKEEFLKYLNETIGYLQGAGIRPLDDHTPGQ